MADTFPALTIESAPEGARALMRATEQRLGFLPSALARQATAPLIGQTFATLLRAWNGTAFTPLEREVVTFVMAHHTGCELCVAMHGKILEQLGASEELRASSRRGEAPSEPRLRALDAFARAVLDTSGAVDDAALDAFFRAGFAKEQALEVVVGVATYVLSTFANRMVRAEVDAPLSAYAPR